MDNSFLKLYLNDFASAIKGDNPNIATITYRGFVQQSPSETFLQITNSETDINFVGGIQVDLVDICEKVVKNINGNFFYEGVQDANGIYQIAYEFGNIGVDYYMKPLFLRITDLINGNVFYSECLCISDFNLSITSRFDYTSNKNIEGTSYDLMPYIQSIRFANLYDNNPANVQDLKTYTQFSGNRVSFRNITTYLRKFLFDRIDFSISDRLNFLFSNQIIYLNNERVTITDFKIGDRVGDTNVINGGEFLANKQGEKLVFSYQLYEGLSVVSLTPEHESFTTSFDGYFDITFNKTIELVAGITAKIYKDDILIGTFTPTSLIDTLQIDATSYNFDIGVYSVVIEPNKVKSTQDYWIGFAINEWIFTVATGEYDGTQYSNEYLIN